MKLKVFLTLVSLVFFTYKAASQDTTSVKKLSKWDLGLEGMIGVAVGENFYSVNAGGPGFFLVLNKNWKIGIGALPSFYLLDNKLGARLGVSPRIDYKNLVLIAPFFHKDRTDEWIWSVGFGYKFHKK